MRDKAARNDSEKPNRPSAEGGELDAGCLSFEEIVADLQNVVQDLEEGELPLEKALESFERGVRLARLGARRLDEAERRIEILLSDDEGVRTSPLDKEPEAK